MQKKHSYICTECNAVSSGWSGKCFSCKTWNSVIEVGGSSRSKTKTKAPLVERIGDRPSDGKFAGFKSGIKEFDRLLGGCLVQGSVVLIGGEPGIGKSTLAMQIAAALSRSGNCIYVSGEESSSQVRLRAERVGARDSEVRLLASTSLEEILSALDVTDNVNAVIIDSIQSLSSEACPSSAGTIAQVRFCAQEITNYAKRKNITVIILCQVTKDGQIAGPKMLEHMVDVVLYFADDIRNGYLLLRSTKNRFASSNEVGIFEMKHNGVFSVENPSFLLGNRETKSAGSVIFCGLEGSRTILMEIQTLVSKGGFQTPRRAVVGWDVNRLAMIIAVLSSKCKVFLHDREVYLNVAGGFKIQDPSVDLAVALSLISSISDIPVPDSAVVFGEIALSGEVRGANRLEARIKEASGAGFDRIICPDIQNTEVSKGIVCSKIKHVADLRKVLSV